MKHPTLAILGAGSWGTAIAIHLATAKHHVLLWGPDPKIMAAMANTKHNAAYLPDISFPNTLHPTADLARCLNEADEVCIAVPSHAFRIVLEQLPHPPKRGLIWLTKGLDPGTQLLLSQVVKLRWGETYPCAILSGPSFAQELAKALPTAITLACDHTDYQQTLLNYFQHHSLRIYLTQDLIGVQICGAMKNIMAIACGMSDGLGFGANAKAALITRGLAEMRRLGIAMGAMDHTFMGLAGLGDLVLTCTDDQSRNRRFGLALGRGVSLKQALAQLKQVVEGCQNVSQVLSLAKRHNTVLPICESVQQVLSEKMQPAEAATYLMHKISANQYE